MMEEKKEKVKGAFTADLVMSKVVSGVKAGEDGKPAGNEVREVVFDVKNQRGGILEPRIKLDGAFFQKYLDSGKAPYRVKMLITAEYEEPKKEVK